MTALVPWASVIILRIAPTTFTVQRVLFGNLEVSFSQQAGRGRMARQNPYFGFGCILGREGPVWRARAIPTATKAFVVLLEAKIGGCAGDSAGTDETFPKTKCVGAFAANMDAPMDPGES
ncbi:hypothetical protein [Bradyrhizobium neotropicale]|uniref:hypothetical protein n=1 Tax=Bradyrhizobium neotropicale TaxID=1497615 RepID=UPI0011AB4145|nr:hypothetical protein [Bradyrhizobium neotropicale]